MNSPALRRQAPVPPGEACLTLSLPVPGVRAGITARPLDGADREQAARLVSRLTGVPGGRVVHLRQIHSRRVWTVGEAGLSSHSEGDALVSRSAGLALSVRVADCAPVVLAADDASAIGIVHAGWRGAAAGVAGAAVQALCTLAGCPPEQVHAALGPSLGRCCFEVGPEVAVRFASELIIRDGSRLLLDLPGTLAIQLEAAGLAPGRIDRRAAVCTLCNRGAPEGLSFYSHRGSSGGPGRNIAFIVKDDAS